MVNKSGMWFLRWIWSALWNSRKLHSNAEMQNITPKDSLLLLWDSGILKPLLSFLLRVILFYSGKIVCTGAKNCELSKQAAKKYAKIIKNCGFDVKFTDFKVQNIVGSCDVGFPIKLEYLHSNHMSFCQVFIINFSMNQSYFLA